MHEVLRATCDNPLFDVTSAPYLVLDATLRIQAVNPAYLRATGRQRDELLSAFMFDAFPDPPHDAAATGVRNLSGSLTQVLRRARPHDMGVQRYDIPDTSTPGSFRVKTWSPVNAPLLDADGYVVGVLHHVEDITAVDELLSRADSEGLSDGTQQSAAALRRMTLAIASYQRAFSPSMRPDAEDGETDWLHVGLTLAVARSQQLRRQSEQLRQIAQWLRERD